MERTHLNKLADAFFKNLIFDSGTEFGYVGLDCKRPFGNSYVEGDILKIIELPEPENGFTEEQEQYARILYCEKLIPYLKGMWRDHKSTFTAGSSYRRTVSKIDKA